MAGATAGLRFALALRCFRGGDLEGAEALAGQCLEFDPDHADALHLLGVIALRRGDAGKAVRWLKQAVAAAPDDAGKRTDLGAALQAGRAPEQAVEAYRAALALDPTQTEAANGLGVVLGALGRATEAVEQFREVLDRRSDHPGAHVNLGNVLLGTGDLHGAEAHYRAALAVEPASREAQVNLGLVLWRAGRLDDALDAYRSAIGAGHDSPDLRCSIGRILVEKAAFAEAAAIYRAVLDSHPDHYPTLVAAGDLAAAESRMEDADEFYRRAAAIKPSDGLKLKTALRLPAVYASAEALHEARRRLEENIAALATVGLSIADPVAEVGITNFRAAYHGLDDRPLQEAIARLYLKACPSLAYVAPHCRDRAGSGREPRPVRVGLVSTKWREYAVTWYLRGILEHLPRSDLTVELINVGGGAVWAPLAAAVDDVVEVPRQLDQARTAIAARELDVLVYPEIGMTALTYFLAFARLAPVQCVTWGHPVTTGVPTMDYFLSSDAAEPDDGQCYYSERLVRLPGLTTCYARPDMPPPHSRADLGLDERATLYCYPHALFKLHPDFDAVLHGILDEDRTARIVMFSDPGGAIADGLKARWGSSAAVDGDRITFLAMRPFEDFLAILQASDVILDAFPFAGGNTTYQALGIGTPLVSLRGKTLAGRTATMLFERAGLEELLADSPEAYVAIAIRLGRDAAYRDAMRGRILDAASFFFEDRLCVDGWARFLLAAGRGTG
ncbi:MAG: hypothetical protein CMM50_10770 [Rhodospirillaceae bacterium]|nr:hypothetical protein [Rhodospirillaceae bacterium]